MGCVYCATNKANGKVYIGKTINTLAMRMMEHKSNAFGSGGKYQRYFQRAIVKYGMDGFKWDILFESDNDDDLCQKEMEYIKMYQSFGPSGYNLTMGGDGTVGYSYTKEQREHMSAIQKIVSSDPDRKIAMSKRILKYRQDHPEHKYIIANALRLKLKKEWENPEYRLWQHNRSVGGNNPAAVKIKCIETGEIFGCIKDAALKYNRSATSIGEVLDKPNRTSAKLHWQRTA